MNLHKGKKCVRNVYYLNLFENIFISLKIVSIQCGINNIKCMIYENYNITWGFLFLYMKRNDQLKVDNGNLNYKYYKL